MIEKIAKNTTWLTASLILQKTLSFFYFWFISNNLFPSDLGKYVFALSFTTLFSIFIDLGLSQILIREGAKNFSRTNKYLKNILALKIPLLILTILVAVAVINLTGKSSEIRMLVYLAIIVMTLDSFTLSFFSVFRSTQLLKYESMSSVVFQVINILVGVFALKLTGRLEFLILALICASAFNFIIALVLLKTKFKFSLMPSWDKETIKILLKILPAFALAGIFIKIYNTSDSVLLGYISGDKAVGFFAVPAKVIFAIQMIVAGSFAAAIYPAFSNFYITSKEFLKNSFENSVFYLLLISVPSSLGIYVLAPKIIDLLWPQYQQSVSTFKVMALAMPFIFVAFATGTLLNACDRQNKNTINRGIITLVSLFLNILLIPRYDQLGSGMAFLCTNIALVALDTNAVRKLLPKTGSYIARYLYKIIVASSAMVITLKILSDFNIIFVIGLAATVYFAVLYLLKTFTSKDIRNLGKIIFSAEDEKVTPSNN
ncbi:flippase [Candidatus Parcubacteria bacterium]|nr:MAG: flippase [Candidatus Parcubacteria bacterium]